MDMLVLILHSLLFLYRIKLAGLLIVYLIHITKTNLLIFLFPITYVVLGYMIPGYHYEEKLKLIIHYVLVIT